MTAQILPLVIGAPQIILIVVVVLLLFGGKKIPEFKDASKEDKSEKSEDSK